VFGGQYECRLIGFQHLTDYRATFKWVLLYLAVAWPNHPQARCEFVPLLHVSDCFCSGAETWPSGQSGRLTRRRLRFDFRQGRPLYIWMYTPSAVSTFGWICALFKSSNFIFISFSVVWPLPSLCEFIFLNLNRTVKTSLVVKTKVEWNNGRLHQSLMRAKGNNYR
jgi:hypothetical protein